MPEPTDHGVANESSDQAEQFDFRFAPAYRRTGLIFGITPRTAWVRVDGKTVFARFGPWRVRTPLANVADAQATGPYAFIKTAGPARLGVTDRGLTFATNGERGALITFRRPITGMEPTGLLRHPELTVTVADVDGLVALLRERIDR